MSNLIRTMRRAMRRANGTWVWKRKKRDTTYLARFLKRFKKKVFRTLLRTQRRKLTVSRKP